MVVNSCYMRCLKTTFIILFCCQAVFSRGFPDKSIVDSLTPFYLVFHTGDLFIRTYELKVYRENNRYFASYVEPTFYVGGEIDSNWIVELDSSKILACIKFINKAKTLPKECEDSTSSIHEYDVSLGNDTIKITGECDWDSSNFYTFSGLLFKERFSELELKRSALNKRLNKQLQGEWYFTPKKELKNWDSLILSRISNSDLDCVWEFRNDSLFKSSYNSFLDLAYSNQYNGV